MFYLVIFQDLSALVYRQDEMIEGLRDEKDREVKASWNYYCFHLAHSAMRPFA